MVDYPTSLSATLRFEQFVCLGNRVGAEILRFLEILTPAAVYQRLRMVTIQFDPEIQAFSSIRIRKSQTASALGSHKSCRVVASNLGLPGWTAEEWGSRLTWAYVSHPRKNSYAREGASRYGFSRPLVLVRVVSAPLRRNQFMPYSLPRL
jgi:hypothetical protein